jgi:hypothetical protein
MRPSIRLVLAAAFILALATACGEKATDPLADRNLGSTPHGQPAHVIVMGTSPIKIDDTIPGDRVTLLNSGDLPAYAVEVYYVVACNTKDGPRSDVQARLPLGTLEGGRVATVDIKNRWCDDGDARGCRSTCWVSSGYAVRWSD